MTPQRPAVGEPFPAIELPTLSGRSRMLGKSREGFSWQLVLVYRGKHCPLCTKYLRELNDQLDALNELGVDVIAVSADGEERARSQINDVRPRFDVAYDLSLDQMNTLGLYVSGPRNGIDVDSPFAEPGLFVINAEGQLQIADISNVPFARPNLEAIVRGIRVLRGITEIYPINGTYAA